MYPIQLSKEMMERLWWLKAHYGRGPIIGQIKEAVYRYLHEEEEKLGHPIEQLEGDRE